VLSLQNEVSSAIGFNGNNLPTNITTSAILVKLTIYRPIDDLKTLPISQITYRYMGGIIRA
jgi:hypothetical protein